MISVIPVVFCFDKRIILGASVAIKSLLDCAKESTTYDVRIFHSDLSLENQKNLSMLCENTRHNISFHYINPKLFSNAPNSKGSWSEIVYYRFLIPQILDEYEKAIYSDVDVLFKDDLSDLYNTDLEEFELGAVRAELNTPNSIGHKYFEENKKQYIYWSGLLIFNNKVFKENDVFSKLIHNATENFDRLKFFDLDLMNITCQKIKTLDFKYCVLQSIYYNEDLNASNDYGYLKNIYSDKELCESKSKPAIIHYAGNPGKPWRMRKPYGDYKVYLEKLPKALKFYTFRDVRKKLFSKV